MPSFEGECVASIDLGSHTARLLISERVEGPGLFHPIARERTYIRLADGQNPGGMKVISPRAMARALKALKTFVTIAEKYGVGDIHTAATGIMRGATNRDEVLDLISREAGIRPRVVTGEEEAQLTARGVLHALDTGSLSYRIFDLGGATTEFITGQRDVFQILSLPLGAMTLTRECLFSDPPTNGEIETLSEKVDGILKGRLQEGEAAADALLVGTGGTVTTLGAMIHHIAIPDIHPEGMNGLTLEREAVEALFEHMKGMPGKERVRLAGLDRGRADVILAGTLVVLRIMHIFQSPVVTISMSDILEGILIEALGSTRSD